MEGISKPQRDIADTLQPTSSTEENNIRQINSQNDLLQFITFHDNAATNIIVEEAEDPELLGLLVSWGFGDLYYEFIEQQISIEVLKVLIEKDVDEIFEKKKKGLKYAFRNRLVKWRNENGIPTPSACQTEVSSIHIESAVSSWLEKNLKSFVEANSSSGSSRSSPTPSEEFEIYYTPPIPPTILNPGGRLYSKYYNTRKRLSKIGFSVSSKSNVSSSPKRSCLDDEPEIQPQKTIEVEKENEENDEEEQDEEDSDDDENEEEDERRNVERDFKFEDFAKRLLNPKIVRACTIALSDWETMPTKSLKAAVTILYRIAFELKCFAMLYQANLFKIFQKVFNTPRDKHSEELRRLGIYIVRQFVEMAPKNPKIFAELLFYKTLKEANDLENGYTDTYHGATKGSWTEAQEEELRMLFDENQRNPQTDQDVIDWILDNLIDKTRTRRGVLKKLKEMGLTFQAPTKKSSAAAARKNLWQHEEDETLKSLYDEFRLESDCLARIMESFGERRSKNHIIKRMIQLGLIADKSEIVPQKPKKPRKKKQQATTSDSETDNVQEEKSRKRSKRKSTKSKPKSKKSIVKSPLDISSVKFLIAQVDENLKEALEWFKESLKDAAQDFEEVSEDNDDGVPLLPLQAIEKEAIEDETFKRLLISLGIQPPIEETDTYWKIPVYLNAADLNLRVEVLNGTYNPSSSEVVEDQDNEIDDNESGDESNSSQESDEGTDTSASDSSADEDNESVSGSESHASVINKRRERFDNLLFNQSDNEDEHRAPLIRKTVKTKKNSAEGSTSRSHSGRRSKKINVNDMLMDEGSDKDENKEDEVPHDDSVLDDFDSENLRKRLAELVDDDDEDEDNSETGEKTRPEKTRRVRRNIIDSDSSDAEGDNGVGNNENTNQDNSINGVDSQKNDYQSSITINGNNKVNTADDKPRQQHVDRNNQSSSLLANSSGEFGDFPSNSLRMSPTPEDGDYAAANVNVDNNKRSRNDINAGSDVGEVDEEEVVAKKKKLNEKDTGHRRWAAIIDDDSD